MHDNILYLIKKKVRFDLDIEIYYIIIHIMILIHQKS